jgi:hypothetical protein
LVGQSPANLFKDSITITFLLHRKNAYCSLNILLSVFLILMRLALVSVFLTSSPSLLIIWLVLLTFYLGLILRKVLSSWVIYAVVLLFTGGIIILFIYILTLVMSVKVVFTNVNLELRVLASRFILIFFFVPNEVNTSLNLSNMFLIRRINYVIFLAVYLFLVLLVVVKLSSGYKGALKSVFKYDKDLH